MSEIQHITRITELDIAHRVMDEYVKCHSLHGHRIKVEMRFSFTQREEIGYYIDFKEIKRIGAQWLDDRMDHGFIANPHDQHMINACQQTASKLYIMSLHGQGVYCNPSAENVSREIFLAMEMLFAHYPALTVDRIRYYETPNCWIDTTNKSIQDDERTHFHAYRGQAILQYAADKGKIEYDQRKHTSTA